VYIYIYSIEAEETAHMGTTHNSKLVPMTCWWANWEWRIWICIHSAFTRLLLEDFDFLLSLVKSHIMPWLHVK